jgi:hypothetical protein
LKEKQNRAVSGADQTSLEREAESLEREAEALKEKQKP